MKSNMQVTLDMHRRPMFRQTVTFIVVCLLLVGCIGKNSSLFDRDSDDDNDNDGGGNPAAIGQIFAVTQANRLISFEADRPAVLGPTLDITGLAAGETITGIDFRPSSNDLYAVSDQGSLYIISTETGEAVIDSTTDTIPNGTAFGIDINPVADRLRLLSDSGQNLSIDPDDGNTQTDDPLAYVSGDTNVGANPNINAGAYTNSFQRVTATTLYVIDSSLDVLATLDPIADGSLNTIGPLGIDANQFTALDIEANGRAFAALTESAATTSSLYRINLVSGAATLVGAIGGEEIITGLAVQTPATPVVFALGGNNFLISFNPQTPDTLIDSVSISGLQTGEFIFDMDFRPQTQELYALSNQANLYILDTDTGQATLASTLDTDLSGGFFGVDFDPVEDSLLSVSDIGQNLRVDDVEDGLVSLLDPLDYSSDDDNDGSTPNVISLAHTNSFNGANDTVLYGIDSALDILVQISDPETGELQTIGDLGFDSSNLAGFDIAGNDGLALLALNTPGFTFSQLYTLNLETGQATQVGTGAISNLNITINGLTIQLPEQ